MQDDSGRRYLPVLELTSAAHQALEAVALDQADVALPRVRVGARAKTISIARLSKRELERGRREYLAAATTDLYERPVTRADCLHGEHAQRPCPWISCARHLYLDVDPDTGSVKVNFPDVAVEDMPETCSLDVADRGGITLEEVGAILNLTRERIRQLETRGLGKLRLLKELGDLADWADLDKVLRDPRKASVKASGEGDEGPVEHGVSGEAREVASLPGGVGALDGVARWLY